MDDDLHAAVIVCSPAYCRTVNGSSPCPCLSMNDSLHFREVRVHENTTTKNATGGVIHGNSVSDSNCTVKVGYRIILQ